MEPTSRERTSRPPDPPMRRPWLHTLRKRCYSHARWMRYLARLCAVPADWESVSATGCANPTRVERY